MTARRDARAGRLLDPEWHWLADARDRLYAEVDPGAIIAGLSLVVINDDGVMVTYSAHRDGQITRVILADPESLAEAAAPLVIDATIREEERP